MIENQYYLFYRWGVNVFIILFIFMFFIQVSCTTIIIAWRITSFTCMGITCLIICTTFVVFLICIWFPKVSSSVSFSTLLNCLIQFWILYLWVKINPKHSILEINAVKCVYVESCYKIFMSTYKKLNYNDDITNLSKLPFGEMYLFLEWNKSMTHR